MPLPNSGKYHYYNPVSYTIHSNFACCLVLPFTPTFVFQDPTLNYILQLLVMPLSPLFGTVPQPLASTFKDTDILNK